MSSEADASAEGLPAIAKEAPLRRAPTLYAIIVFKLAKGVLFCAFGIVLYFQATHNLPKYWEELLKQPFVERVFARLSIHPENKFFQRIAEQIANVPTIHHLAVAAMLFSLFPLVEGIGMLYRAGWAGWLAIGESAFFVPIWMYDLAKKYSHYMLLTMIINILIVWYLYANRASLFHHHHHREPPRQPATFLP